MIRHCISPALGPKVHQDIPHVRPVVRRDRTWSHIHSGHHAPSLKLALSPGPGVWPGTAKGKASTAPFNHVLDHRVHRKETSMVLPMGCVCCDLAQNSRGVTSEAGSQVSRRTVSPGTADNALAVTSSSQSTDPGARLPS